MKTEIFEVENLKCSGCAATVKKALLEKDGVSAVDVEVSEGIVKVNLDGVSDRAMIFKELRRLGYPEKGTGNILDKGKSFVSCAVGRVENKQQ
ncbi:MAG: heavy-metal-associated domain-containing protein [Cyclobacteriaceae bacterium]